MPAITSALIGKTINFQTNAPSILGARFQVTKVLSILDPDTARLFADIVSQHIAVYPHLPEGTVDDAFGYSYVKLRLPDDQIVVLGLPWIDENSVEVVNHTTLTVKINSTSQEDINRVRQALLANGFEDFTITPS